MLKSDALKVMATIAAAVMGEKNFNTTSPEFQKQAVEGASFVDAIEKATKEFDEVSAATPWTPEDCVALFNLIAALQQTVAQECPIV